jgi:Holliday junction resolvase-like predicted endonuclease
VEVKTKASSKVGRAEEVVTERKQAHHLGAAQPYLQSIPEFVGDWQVDVIAIEMLEAKKVPHITHFKNVIN